MTPENVQHLFKEAIKNNDSETLCRTLQSDDMDINFRDVTHDLETPLMQLCHSSAEDKQMSHYVGIVTAKQPQLDIQDAIGRTLAMHACIAVRLSMLQFALSRDCDVTICDRTGKNVFHYGASSGNDDVMDLLLQHSMTKSSLRVLDFKGYSPLDLARQVKSQSIVRKISQTLNGHSNTASIPRQPLKPMFKPEKSLQSVQRSIDRISDGENSSLRPHGPTVETDRHVNLDSGSKVSRADVLFPLSPNHDKSRREITTHGNVNRFMSMSSLRSPRQTNANNSSLGSIASASFNEPFDTDLKDSDERTDLSADQISSTQESCSPSPSFSQERQSCDSSLNDNSGHGSLHSPQNASTPLANLVMPRRKIINLNMQQGRDSSPSSFTGVTQSTSGGVPKPRTVISELKPDSRRAFNHRPQAPDSSHPISRPEMKIPLKEKAFFNEMKSETSNLNALLSPQQPHRRLLQKRREMGCDNKHSSLDKDCEKNPNDQQDSETEDSVFEEEILLDSSQSSATTNGQKPQSRLKGRRSSLSLPDLRDMTGCLVTSPNPSSPQDEAGNMNFLRLNNLTDGVREGQSFLYSSDEDDGDYGEIEDGLSDDFIENCSDEAEGYLDLVKSTRSGKNNDGNVGNLKNRNLPAINAPTPRKGRTGQKF